MGGPDDDGDGSVEEELDPRNVAELVERLKTPLDEWIVVTPEELRRRHSSWRGQRAGTSHEAH